MSPLLKLTSALLFGTIVYWLYPATREEQASREPVRLSRAAISAHYGPSLAVPGHLPNALVPPAAPGMFSLNQDGALIVDPAVAYKLDILLAQLPERATLQEMQRVEERVKAGLPDDAAREAVDLLRRYAAYRNAETELELSARRDGTTAETLLGQLIALRRTHLGPAVADAMFASREAQAMFGIQSVRIQADPALNGKEKRQRIESLRQSLPAEANALDEDAAGTRAVHALEEEVEVLRQRGTPESEVWQMRLRALGPEGARHITEMEKQRLEWERRYQVFMQQKNVLLAGTIPPQQKQEAVEALMRRHYAEHEINIVRAYDRWDAQK